MKEREFLIGYEKEDGELWLWDDIPEKGIESGYKVEEMIYYQNSPYQEISIIDTKAFGKILVLDGIPQYTTKDGFIYNEMLTHIPLTTHPHPQKVAIIGGGSCGAAREVVKYDHVELVDIVEIDKQVAEVSLMNLSEENICERYKGVQMIYRDGIDWIKEQKNNYDVLILDRSDPYGPSTGFYKKSFYKRAYNCLKDDGIMVCQSESPYFYLDILKDTYKNLKELFPVVRIYLAAIPSFPGGIWSFAVASKKWDPLNADLDRLKCENTKYINKNLFLSSFNLPNYIMKALE